MKKNLFFASALLTIFTVFYCAPETANADNPRLSVNQQFQEIKNLLINPGFEFVKQDWTNSGGTFTVTTTTANVDRGQRTASWDASATAQYLRTTLYTVPSGLFGATCAAKIRYRTTETVVPYVLELLDASSNVISSQSLTATTYFQDAFAIGPCGTTGSLRVNVRTASSAGDPAVIYVDSAYLGKAYPLTGITQAAFMGSAVWPGAANCEWSNSSTYANFSTDSDCTTPVSGNLVGNALAPTTKVPGVRFTNLPPGRYEIKVVGLMHKLTAGDNRCSFRIHDGTAAMVGEGTAGSSASVASASTDGIGTLVATAEYLTAQSDITFQIQSQASGAAACGITNTSNSLNFIVTRYPLATEAAYRVDDAGWFVDANISGANPSLGTSSVTSYTGIENSSLTLTQNPGSSQAFIPCSSTNDSTGTTCSAGNESIGVAFTPPRAGTYLACASFSSVYDVGGPAANGTLWTYFQVVETPNTAQTISQEGKSRVGSGPDNTLVGRFSSRWPNRVCGTFNFASVGKKTLRLFYEQFTANTVVASSVSADADTGNGQRDIHWEVYPVNQQFTAPLIVGSVTSNTTGLERVERASVSIADASTCTVSKQSGAWIASGVASSSVCTLTLNTGMFSSAPDCVCSRNSQSSPMMCSVNASSATSVLVGIYNTSGTVQSGITFNLMCMGPR